MTTPARVARLFVAGLAQDLRSRMRDLLADSPLDIQKGKALAEWLKSHFRFDVSRTPKGGKSYKDELTALHWYLANRDIEGYRANIEDKWEALDGKLDDVVRLFTDEGGKVVPRELKVGSNVYVNEVGFDEKKLAEYADGIEKVFASLKGWRKKALTGGLRVVMASPKSFGGTAGGKYRSSEDTLYVRATPAVLKRTRGTYGAIDYIIVHELGHRYDFKFRPKFDFDKSEWWSTDYSRKEGESFAELFALTNFGMSGPLIGAAKPDVLERFEQYMTSGKVPETESRELPPHLKKLLER